MEKRDKFLTFVTACIPGIGYIYNGLVTKGIETFLMFVFINIFFDLIGLNVIGAFVKFVFWLYVFIDSLKVAERIDRGVTVPDSGFIFDKHFDTDKIKVDLVSKSGGNNKTLVYLGWGLVIVGALSLMNRLLVNNEFYIYLKQNMHTYSLPILLILFGIFLLFRKK